MSKLITPNWPAPHYIQAFSTLLSDTLPPTLPNRIEWIKQTHSTRCVTIEATTEREAVDASVTRQHNCALVIKTADCLPILLFSQAQPEIAAIHAGWRGLAEGVIESTLAQIKSAPNALTAWIGPAICGECFEVGGEVCDIFLSRYPFAKEAIFPYGEKWRIDLKKVATLLLNNLGINQVYQSPLCTFEEKALFSYRRDKQTGRMGTFIWMTEP